MSLETGHDNMSPHERLLGSGCVTCVQDCAALHTLRRRWSQQELDAH